MPAGHSSGIYKLVKDPNLVSALTGHVEGSRAFTRYRTIDIDMKKDLVKILEGNAKQGKFRHFFDKLPGFTYACKKLYMDRIQDIIMDFASDYRSFNAEEALKYCITREVSTLQYVRKVLMHLCYGSLRRNAM